MACLEEEDFGIVDVQEFLLGICLSKGGEVVGGMRVSAVRRYGSAKVTTE